ncbi:hydrolase [Hephaestia sp. GCM10023244]|uniref:hydrolase n=1 Tax=unclassified Hephaestia TaxID=2631281 RepID=UPI0020776C58|nr:hydrolase [Hephaestia sp. MAHUQ-44]MCM8729536.1 hydrolase [Hephaestia sp. MAHUQ-44]
MKISVRAHEMATLLDRAPVGVTTLSLDCFDTLLWRDVQAPRDVFAGIEAPGGAIEMRMWAEQAARRAAKADSGRSETVLPAIYERFLPGAARPAIDAAVAHELDLEARHCFGFAPTIALIRAAKAKGLQVIIVSDTYLDEDQLSTLIARAAGNDVRALIDRIFVSSAHGVSKGDGLFRPVLDALGARPETILHCGDNRIADQVAPDALGIHSAHLVQFDDRAAERLRLESVAAAMIEPTARVSTPISQTHRAEVAMRVANDPAAQLGHDVLGPIMHAFAHWLKSEIADLSARLGKPVHPLFLMRDGHLPLRVFRAAFDDGEPAAPVEISRIASLRASLTDVEALRRVVVEAVDRAPLAVVADQLMLPGHEAKKLAKLTPRAFCRAVTRPDLARVIIARSRKFTDRLIAHLNHAGVAHGDAVMLIDLGYNGSVQNLIEPVLVERMGLDVAGRYLLLREEQLTGHDKKGLLDVRHYDARMLHALCGCIAVIEQLSTLAQGSVVDYEADGTPIRKAADIKGGQSAIRDAVQDACVDFSLHAGHHIVRGANADGGADSDADATRRAAAAALGRLLFMPCDTEAHLLEAFDHDVNLGTSEVVRLLDPQEAAIGLRWRGLAYINETDRMFVPGELRGHGLPLNLALFSSSRFALDLRDSDFTVGGIDLPVILMNGSESGIHRFEAIPTSDGFYRLDVPVSKTRWTPAIQLGAICEWAQIESASWRTLANVDARNPACGTHAVLIPDSMEEQGTGLYRCGETGVLVAPPPGGNEPVVLSLIFRPVVRRTAAAQQREAA